MLFKNDDLECGIGGDDCDDDDVSNHQDGDADEDGVYLDVRIKWI